MHIFRGDCQRSRFQLTCGASPTLPGACYGRLGAFPSARCSVTVTSPALSVPHGPAEPLVMLLAVTRFRSLCRVTVSLCTTESLVVSPGASTRSGRYYALKVTRLARQSEVW